jgi:hypothetical protein
MGVYFKVTRGKQRIDGKNRYAIYAPLNTSDDSVGGE